MSDMFSQLLVQYTALFSIVNPGQCVRVFRDHPRVAAAGS